MPKIQTIVGKEWAEVFKNRFVLFTVIFLPVVMVALPLITLAITGGMGDSLSASGDIPASFGDLCAGLSEAECVQVYTLDLFTLMLMILPVVIPVTIAAYSIVGEKTSRSLEPLLATPITTVELVVGKAVAAVTPAILATWLGYTLYVTGTWVIAGGSLYQHLLAPTWLLAILVVGPLLSLLSVSVALMISSRVTDPRAAEQLSALVVMPLILLVVGQSVGFILIDRRVIIILGVVVAALDVLLMFLSVRVFQRETILTRWK